MSDASAGEIYRDVIDIVEQVLLPYLGIRNKYDVRIKHNLIESLGADSLDVFEILMQVEYKFTISIDDDVAATWVTVGDIIDYVENNQ